MDFFNTHHLAGMRVIVQPDTHRTLPAEVCPGAPWPPGFKEEIDAWMRGFFKPLDLINDGEVLHDRVNNLLHMNQRTFDNLKRAAEFMDKLVG